MLSNSCLNLAVQTAGGKQYSMQQLIDLQNKEENSSSNFIWFAQRRYM